MSRDGAHTTASLDAHVGFVGIELESIDVPAAEGPAVRAHRLVVESSVRTKHRCAASVPFDRGHLRLEKIMKISRLKN